MADTTRINRSGGGTMIGLHHRTMAFAIRIVRMYARLPKSMEARVLGQQVLRSGTSVGANYREATRARTSVEFVSKLRIALQELEETDYWLELLVEAGIIAAPRLVALRKETDELIAMLVASIKTARRSVAAKRTPA